MTGVPVLQIVATRKGVEEVPVVSTGKGDEEVQLYRALLPAIDLINRAVRDTAPTEGQIEQLAR